MVEGRSPGAENPFIPLIQNGSIRTQAELRRTYRTLTIRTHPDAAGSTRLVGVHIRLTDHFREARKLLQEMAVTCSPDAPARDAPRLSFFRNLECIERLELPYAFHERDNQDGVLRARHAAEGAMAEWRPDLVPLYREAASGLTAIKRSRPAGPYLKKALGLNIRPLLHNLIFFHLTGQNLYRRQARQNLGGILDHLTREGYPAVRQFLELLVADMEDGPACRDKAGVRAE